MTSRVLFVLRHSYFVLLLLYSSNAFPDSPSDEIARIEQIVQNKKASKAVINELIQTLKSPETSIQVKERTAWALGELEARDAGPVLIEAAKNKGLLVRSAALNALIHLRARSALPTFVTIAESDPILSL